MIRVVDWNINGGHLVKNDLIENNFDFFLTKLKNLKPDILFIQEGHISDELNQVEVLSKELNLPYFEVQNLGNSHIEKGNQLCLFILSKYKINSSSFYELKNPNFVSIHEKYGEVRSDIFKKGFLISNICINSKNISLVSMHGHPFHLFGKNIDDYPDYLDEIKNQIAKLNESSLILGGDFNYKNVKDTFRDLFEKRINLPLRDIKTCKHGQFDYIVLSNDFKVIKKNVDYCTDDHALIYVDLEE